MTCYKRAKFNRKSLNTFWDLLEGTLKLKKKKKTQKLKKKPMQNKVKLQKFKGKMIYVL